ncbi:MAG: phosphatase PAP2 family protein [Actinobacteria bacterium]|nr:phosphatase PAP2 family protein [Actinomycetota bacterium]
MPPSHIPTDAAAASSSGHLDRLDRAVSRRMSMDWPHPRWSTLPLGGISLSANYGVLWYVLCLMPWALGAERPFWKAVYVAVPVTLVEMTGFAIKHLVGRRRPPVADPTQPRQIPLPASKSFPSSHAGMAVVGTFTLGTLYPQWVPALLALTLVLCFSRVYLGVHYLGDVLGGVVYGLVWGAAWTLLVPAPV